MVMSAGEVMGAVPSIVWIILAVAALSYILYKMLRNDAGSLERGEERDENRERVAALNEGIDTTREAASSMREADDISHNEADFERVKSSSAVLSEKIALYEKDHALVPSASIKVLLSAHKKLIATFVGKLSFTVKNLDKSSKILNATVTQLKKENTQLVREAGSFKTHVLKVSDQELIANIKTRQSINKQIFDYNAVTLDSSVKFILRRKAELEAVKEFLKKMKDLQHNVSKVKSVDELRVFFSRASNFLVSQQTFFAQSKAMQLEFTKLIEIQKGALVRKKGLFDKKDVLQAEYKLLFAKIEKKKKAEKEAGDKEVLQATYS